MTITILAVYKRIVVDKILVTRVVRRININHIDFTIMGIAEGSESFEVVALYKDMIGGISIIADDGTVCHFLEHRQFVLQTRLNLLGLVLPHKTILLLRAEQLQQLRLLLIRKTFEFIYLLCEFVFVHKHLAWLKERLSVRVRFYRSPPKQINKCIRCLYILKEIGAGALLLVMFL